MTMKSENEFIILMNAFFFKDKKTPLHLASESGRQDVCKALLDLRADASVADCVSWRESLGTLFVYWLPLDMPDSVRFEELAMA